MNPELYNVYYSDGRPMLRAVTLDRATWAVNFIPGAFKRLAS